MRKIKIAVVFDNLGPYHIARLRALARRCDLLAVELNALSADYDWTSTEQVPFRRVTLMPQDGITPPICLDKALRSFEPEVIFIPGWGTPDALAIHLWATARQVPVVVMSDTQAIDSGRHPVREWIKRRLVRHVAAVFVAGSRHADYASTLFKERKPMLLGYDVVDNNHFAQGADLARGDSKSARDRLMLPPRYLLAVGRFIKKKNLLFLLDAFAQARAIVAKSEAATQPWDLVLLGDGPLRPEIEAHIDSLGLRSAVHLMGFQQYPDLPTYFGLAEAFVMPSTTDQWGLVVNEAMASGLPVIVSHGCGCTPDLIEEGVNGFTFDPTDALALARVLARMDVTTPAEREAMGAASRKRIALWSPDIFADNAYWLAHKAAQAPRRRMKRLDRLLAKAVMRRQLVEISAS